MSRLQQDLPRHAALVTAAALAAVGAATGVTLAVAAVRAQDDALLAAASAHADPRLDSPWTADGVTSEITVETLDIGELPPTMSGSVELAMSERAPQWRTIGDERVVLLVVEPPGVPENEDESMHPHLAVVARAPAVEPSREVVPFTLAYLLFAGLASAGAAWLHRRTVARAVDPLARLAERLAKMSPDDLEPPGIRGEAEEIATVGETVDDLLVRLRVAMEGHRRFAEIAAHELRSPLAALSTDLEAARAGGDARVARSVEVTRRMQATVEALLALSRLRADEIRQERALVRPSALVLEALESAHADLEDAGCRPQVAIGDEPELRLHPTLMVTSITNLLRNAARYAPGSCISVSVKRTADGVCIEVSDDGGAGPGGAAGVGHGLGLLIVRETCAAHGGTFSLEPRPGGGHRATMCLPASGRARMPARMVGNS